MSFVCLSQWPRGLRSSSAAACLLRSWIWIPPGAWMFVCCECCVLSGRGLFDELITHPEESYRLWCVVVFDLETSRMRSSWPALGRSAIAKKKQSNLFKEICKQFEYEVYKNRDVRRRFIAWGMEDTRTRHLWPCCRCCETVGNRSESYSQ